MRAPDLSHRSFVLGFVITSEACETVYHADLCAFSLLASRDRECSHGVCLLCRKAHKGRGASAREKKDKA